MKQVELPASRLHRALLTICPPRFRAGYGVEILSDIDRELRRAEARGGRRARLRYSLAAAADLCRTALREWAGVLGSSLELRSTDAMPAVVVAIAALVVALGARAGRPPAARIVTDELVTTSDSGYPVRELSYWEFARWQSGTREFSSLAAHSSSPIEAVIRIDGKPSAVGLLRVSGEFFQVLGARASSGRLLSAADDSLQSDRVAVVSERLWMERLGGDNSSRARFLTLDGERYRIVGVLAARYAYPAGAEVWVPLRIDRADETHNHIAFLRAIGRLAPSGTIAAAEAEMIGFLAGPPTPALEPVVDELHSKDALAASLLNRVALGLALVSLSIWWVGRVPRGRAAPRAAAVLGAAVAGCGVTVALALAVHEAAKTVPSASTKTTVVAIPLEAHPTQSHRFGFVDSVLGRLRRSSEVVAAGVSLARPDAPIGWEVPVAVPDGPTVVARYEIADAALFRALELDMLEGSAAALTETASDVALTLASDPSRTNGIDWVVGAVRVDSVVISRALAERLMGARSALGATILLSHTRQPVVVTGIVEDLPWSLGSAPRPTLYAPMRTSALAPSFLVARGRSEPAVTQSIVARVVAATDPDQPIGVINRPDEVIADDARRLLRAEAALAALAVAGALAVIAIAAAVRTPSRRQLGVAALVGALAGSVLVAASASLASRAGLLPGPLHFTGVVLPPFAIAALAWLAHRRVDHL